MERELEKEKARRKADKQPGFDGRWYTDVNAHKKYVTYTHVNVAIIVCLL